MLLIGKPRSTIYFYGPFSMSMLNNQRVILYMYTYSSLNGKSYRSCFCAAGGLYFSRPAVFWRSESFLYGFAMMNSASFIQPTHFDFHGLNISSGLQSTSVWEDVPNRNHWYKMLEPYPPNFWPMDDPLIRLVKSLQVASSPAFAHSRLLNKYEKKCVDKFIQQ